MYSKESVRLHNIIQFLTLAKTERHAHCLVFCSATFRIQFAFPLRFSLFVYVLPVLTLAVLFKLFKVVWLVIMLVYVQV